MQNLTVGGAEYEQLADDDMAIDAVVDARIEKQIERMINKDTKKVKKGSALYQERELAECRRVKESFLNLVAKRKKMMLDVV